MQLYLRPERTPIVEMVERAEPGLSVAMMAAAADTATRAADTTAAPVDTSAVVGTHARFRAAPALGTTATMNQDPAPSQRVVSCK